MVFTVDDYTYSVEPYVENDSVDGSESEPSLFRCFCLELNIQCFGDTQETAFDNCVDLVKNEIDSDQKQVPTPFSKRQWGGAFSFEIPADMHKRLETVAAKRNVPVADFISKAIDMVLQKAG